jgi:hypothetical protein
MKEEVGRNYPKAELPGCHDRLIEFISWFDDTIGSIHANWEETRTNHDRIQTPVSISSAKSANLKVAGLSKISDSV